MRIDNFDDLYHKHIREIQRYCFRKLGNREDAEDAANEAFVKAYYKYDPSRNANFRTFIFQVATTHCIDYLRSRRFKIQPQIIPLENVKQLLTAEISQTPIEDQEVLNALFKCLKRLRSEERTAIELYYLKKFTLEQISDIIRKSIGTVRNRMRAGTKKLKLCLKKNQVID